MSALKHLVIRAAAAIPSDEINNYSLGQFSAFFSDATLTIFRIAYKKQDWACIAELLSNIRNSTKSIIDDLVEMGLVSPQFSKGTICDQVEHSLFLEITRPQFCVGNDWIRMSKGELKQVLDAMPITKSPDRLLTVLNPITETLTERVKAGSLHEGMIDEQVFKLDDDVKLFFIIAGAKMLSDADNDPLNIHKLPQHIKRSPFVLTAQRNNGTVSSLVKNPLLSILDRERVDSYPDKLFYSAIELNFDDRFHQLLIECDIPSSNMPFRRSPGFIGLNSAFATASRLNEIELKGLISESVMNECSEISRCDTFRDLSNVFDYMHIDNLLLSLKGYDNMPSAKDYQAQLSPKLLINAHVEHAYLLSVFAKQFERLALAKSEKPLSATELQAAICILHNQMKNHAKYLTNSLKPLLELTDCKALNRIFINLINGQNDHESLTFDLRHSLFEGYVKSAPIKALLELCDSDVLPKDVLYLVEEMAMSRGFSYMLMQPFRIEDSIGEVLAKREIREPHSKQFEKIADISTQRMLCASNIEIRFLQVFNAQKQDLCESMVNEPANMDFLNPKVL